MSSTFENIFSIEIKCGEEDFYLIEFLINQNNFFNKINNKKEENKQIFTEEGIFVFDETNDGGINFGIDFDIKEEIFKVYPFIVDLNLNNLFTLKWKWKLIETNKINNWTSPSINLILFGPNKLIIFNQIIKPYDSLNGIQFVNINLNNIILNNQNVKPGTWSASLLFNSTKIWEIYFPIFPNSNNNFELINKLTLNNFNLIDWCLIKLKNNNIFKNVKNCSNTNWSSNLLNDDKSNFP